MARFGAYYCFVRGVDFDLPWRASVTCAAETFDDVVVVTDQRFKDGTVEALQKLAAELSNVRLFFEEIDFDHDRPLGDWKTRARSRVRDNCDWLIEMEPWWVFDPRQKDRLAVQLEKLYSNVYCVSVGSLNLFNGDHVKLGLQKTQPALSRNHPLIAHGGIERVGTGLSIAEGPLRPSASLARFDAGARTFSSDSVWFYNYEFYCLPTTYEAKSFWHYFKGKQVGKYRTLDDYGVNLDGEPTNMLAPVYRMSPDMYENQIAAEMCDPSIRPVRARHLPIMEEWLARQRIVSPRKWQRMRKLGAGVAMNLRFLRWRLRRWAL